MAAEGYTQPEREKKKRRQIGVYSLENESKKKGKQI